MDLIPVSPNEESLELLKSCGLLVSDIGSSELLVFYGLRDHGTLAGIVGLEVYEQDALIRSLAVSPNHRKLGVGSSLVHFVEDVASERGVQRLYLLTTTAGPFFERLGYEHHPRDQAPGFILATAQFSHLCPGSANFMVKQVRP